MENKKKYMADWYQKNKSILKNKRRKYNKIYMREWRKKNPDKLSKIYRHRVFKQYGITEKQYNLMFKKQNGVCYICKCQESRKHQNGKLQSLSIDHNHFTGKVRGLLCDKCNRGLGFFKHDTKLLNNALLYMRRLYV